ncbi:MAG: TetR/AcrR family transcriptional regulator [Pseudomonadota bacterium]
MPRKTDKRMRLVLAAKTLIHKHGFNLTTLADIAGEANVPLGNVYYYFKTKEAIGLAVIESSIAEWTERLASWSAEPAPMQRLNAFIQYGLDTVDVTARFGCPIGGLCQELGKQGGSLSDVAAKLLHDILAWTVEQFKALGHGQQSADLGLNLLSMVQGMYLLTHTFKDPKISVRQTKAIQNWLQSLSVSKKSGVAQESYA